MSSSKSGFLLIALPCFCSEILEYIENALEIVSARLDLFLMTEVHSTAQAEPIVREFCLH